jgi:2-amino-4-hydroxy-6-hydroxymethyldihydropteridine diphosphokinase
MARVYLALGSNLGNSAANLRAAHQAIAALPDTHNARLSPIYDTAPVGGPAGQNRFANAAIEMDTSLTPRILLEKLQAIEQSLGREPRDHRIPCGPRIIDLDILLYDEQIIEQPGLTIPHPRFDKRRFVLHPLVNLAPSILHPLLKRTAKHLLDDLPATESTPKPCQP